MAKPINTETFAYTNPHPKGDKSLGDCVYRAISIATGKTWLEVYDELAILGREQLAPPNDNKTYTTYLDRIAKRIPAKYQTPQGNIRHIVKSLPKKGMYIVRQANHLVAIKNGKARDTWDSSNRSAYIIWQIGK